MRCLKGAILVIARGVSPEAIPRDCHAEFTLGGDSSVASLLQNDKKRRARNDMRKKSHDDMKAIGYSFLSLAIVWRRASTTAGSNCVPLPFSSSAQAALWDIAGL